MCSKFYYFGFGSNMLAKRIRIQNPTAVRIGPGKLEDYRLDFHTSSKTWQGAPATIVPTNDSHVYGAIWEIDMCNMQDLDNQEGVHEGIYTPITIPIFAVDTGKFIDCRAYHLSNQPQTVVHCVPHLSDIPYDRQPSKTYLKTLIKGAIETGIPDDYVNELRRFKHNDVLVDEMEQKLELHNVCL